MTQDDILKMEAGPELDALVAEKVMGKVKITLEEAVEKIINSSVTMHTENGLWVDRLHKLVFDKNEYDRLFSHGFYIPRYKEWLLQNSRLRYEANRYSTNLIDAWEVVEKLKGMGYEVELYLGTENAVRLFIDKSINENIIEELIGNNGEKVESLICKVALLTVLKVGESIDHL